MKNNRVSKLTALLLAMMMVFSMGIISALADEEGIPSDTWTPAVVVEERELDSFVTSREIVDGNGKQITDLSAADPNLSLTLKLSVSEGKYATEVEKTLPENTNAVRLVYKLENVKVAPGANEVVSWTYNESTQQLVFKWVGAKPTAFEAAIPITPYFPADHDISGSYVLGTKTNVMLCNGTFNQDNRNRANASAFTAEGDKIRPNTDEDPVWVLTHVTGNYYTIRSKNTGKYLRMSEKSLYMEDATPETAQKIQVRDHGNGTYSFHSVNNSQNKNSAITNVGKNAVNGFAVYIDNNAGNGDNELFRLYPESALVHDATIDVAGTWVITNPKGSNILTADTLAAGKLKAVSYSWVGNEILPSETYTYFTFEHVNRNWYTVRCDSGYLNISQSGASISSHPQNLMVRTTWSDGGIMICTGEFDVNRYYALTNVDAKTEKGYGALTKPVYNDNTHLILRTNVIKTSTFVTFNVNGGTVDEVPAVIAGEPGDRVTLPDLKGTKDGEEFIGWATVNSVFTKNPGKNLMYQPVYKPGTSYTLKPGNNTLYAIYNVKSRNVRFGFRADGVIQDEPNDYSVSDYKGHFTVNGILREGRWVIDIDTTKPVNGYYVENDVTANLLWVPSAEQIQKALKAEGNIDFDPETQYVHFYVLKCTGVNVWKVDGVIRNKAKLEISYETNVEGVEKTQVRQMPGAYQVVSGTEILIGTDKNSTAVLTPERDGYVFRGWNTAKDGSGREYNAGEYIRLRENLHLYAQWEKAGAGEMIIVITSDWPAGKPAYAGTPITLTANLTGFEGKTYTLQWQYSTDLENWTDVEGANAINFTYQIDETNAAYTWRVVAKDIN